MALCFPALLSSSGTQDSLILGEVVLVYNHARWLLVALVVSSWRSLNRVARFDRMHAVLCCNVDETSQCQNEINQIQSKHYLIRYKP